MTIHVSGKPTVAAVAPTLHIGTYRCALLRVIIGSDLFTDAEQLRANHNAHECQDAAKLALWTRNARRVATEREAQRNAQTLAGMEQGIARFNARVAAAEAEAQAPAEFTPTAPTPWAIPAQCDEVFRLACQLPRAEKRAALNRLPTLTEPACRAFIRGLHLRLAYGRGASVVLAVPAEQVAAARAQYADEPTTGRKRLARAGEAVILYAHQN